MDANLVAASAGFPSNQGSTGSNLHDVVRLPSKGVVGSLDRHLIFRSGLTEGQLNLARFPEVAARTPQRA